MEVQEKQFHRAGLRPGCGEAGMAIELPPLDVGVGQDEDSDLSSPDLAGGDDVFGFSIGTQQSRLRSPDTPAYEKARALEQSKSYFDADIEKVPDEAGLSQSPDDGNAHQKTGGPAADEDESSGTVRPWKSLSKDQGNDFALESADGGRLDENHPPQAGSSDEPSGMMNSLKRFFPDLPSIPRVSSMPRFNFQRLRPKCETVEQRSRRSQTVITRPALSWIPTAAKPKEEGSKAGIENNRRHPQRPLIRRATSDVSLFIRNELARAETLDGAEKWADVSNMLNARFKAITDSWQDSAMAKMPRIPRFPDLGISKLRSQPNKTATSTRDIGSAAQVTNIAGRSPIPKDSLYAHPILSEAVAGLTGDVVILGGYRGSILRSAKPPHKQLWVPVKVGINLRRVNLEIGLNDEDEEKMPESIIPSGVLSHIGPIDICRRLMRHLKKSSNAQAGLLRVHEFGYDWRLSPHLVSRQLIEFLENLDCNQTGEGQDNKGAVVLAHSLGGLITRHAVNQRPDLFAGVVYAGTPTKAVNILGPLRNGDDVLMSSRVLTAQVNFTIRSSFALLPEDGRCFINKVTGERYEVDFFDPKAWQDNSLSPCVATHHKPAITDQRRSIVGALSESLPSLPFTGKRNSVKLAPKAAPEGPNNASSSLPSEILGSGMVNAQVKTLEPSMQSPPSESHTNNIATTSTIPHAEAMAYLERTLNAVRRFKQETAFQSTHQNRNLYPPIAVLYGDTVPTVFGARVESREAIGRSDCFDNLAFAVGDGIILAKAARPPDGYKIVKNGLVRSDRGHIGLLGDLEAVGQCLQAIINARDKGVGMGILHAEKADDSTNIDYIAYH